MKKILSLILCLISVATIMPTVYAEEAEIEGLHENWSKLFFTNCFSKEEIAEMDAEYMSFQIPKILNKIIPSRVALGRLVTDSEEEEYEYELERAKPNYANGVRVSLLSTNQYAEQYAAQGQFKYLFSGDEYWSVPGFDIYSDKVQFAINGDYIASMREWFGIYYGGFIFDNEEVEFIKNEDNIIKLLKEKGENIVTDMRIFSLNGAHCISFLYIECEMNKYLLRLDSAEQYRNLYSSTNLKEIYDINQIFSMLQSDRKAVVSASKPTYESEATALQSEGLLYGNENGLDLLKPLTRIEAAAMLLRALGESETATADSVQVFSDVPSTHWGYGAAANAYNLGLIYGVGDNLFAPDKRVTATEFASMILRAAGEQEFDWQQAINLLIERGIITQENADTMDFFTRGDMAKIIYEVRAKGLV